MEITISEGFDYVPKIGDNRSRDKKEQVVFHMKFLSAKEYIDLLGNGPLDKAKEWMAYCTGIDNLIVNNEKATPEMLLKKNGGSSLISEALDAYSREKEIKVLK